jgi:cysteine synthase
LYVGVSSGAAVCAALKVTGDCVVAIAPDGGSRYQSDKFWEAK